MPNILEDFGGVCIPAAEVAAATALHLTDDIDIAGMLKTGSNRQGPKHTRAVAQRDLAERAAHAQTSPGPQQLVIATQQSRDWQHLEPLL